MNLEFPADVARFELPFGDRILQCYDTDPSGSPSQTVLMLHGSGGTAAGSFWALLPMLGLRNRVVTFDFLDPREEDGSDFYVDQATAVLNHLSQSGKAHLVGYSLGAVIAATTAAQSPELVQTLTLIAGWAKTDAQQLLRNDLWTELFTAGSPSLGKFAVFSTYSQAYLNARTPAELSALIAINQNGSGRAAKMNFNRSVDIVQRLEKIVAPALVVSCEADQTCPPRHSHMLFGGIENARLLEITAGHGVVHERSSELAANIGDFIRNPMAHPAGTIISTLHA